MKRNRGFPFDEEEGGSAWSELAARHPDVAARLRARPAAAAAWARKRRPASQDGVEDFGGSFDHFDRFPFDDIPPEFREHLPSHWNRRFSTRDDPPAPPQSSTSPPQTQPQRQTAATQTDEEGLASKPHDTLPQYGLRNTVDLGQNSPADPSLIDDRNQRCVSAPPDSRLPEHNYASRMSGTSQQQPDHGAEHAPASNVRHIPIFVEGRDEPVINKGGDHGPAYVPPPPPPEREQYFPEDVPAGFPHSHNFSRPFPTPFNRQAGFRQGPQPFVQQKVYPQNAFARANSPQRSQSPKPHMPPEEHYVKVPVHHEQSVPIKTEHVPSRAHQQQQKPQQQPQKKPQQQKPQPQQPQQHHHQQQQQVPRAHTPPQPQQPPPPPQQPSPANDPISVILNIQTDVLNLMTEVENFTGTKKDKKYIFLDEMLTRNLIKLDNIETDGKENVRQARKEAIKCIQKCIAVLEAKAESNMAAAQASSPIQDVEMKNNTVSEDTQNKPAESNVNGEVEMKDETKELDKSEEVEQQSQPDNAEQPAENIKEKSVQDTDKNQQHPKEEQQKINDQQQSPKADPQADTRQEPQQNETDNTNPQNEEQTVAVETKDKSPKPVKKVANKGGKKRDKSKDKKDIKDDKAENAKEQTEKDKQEKTESMQVDEKGDSMPADGAQTMEVEAAPSPSQ